MACKLHLSKKVNSLGISELVSNEFSYPQLDQTIQNFQEMAEKIARNTVPNYIDLIYDVIDQKNADLFFEVILSSIEQNTERLFINFYYKEALALIVSAIPYSNKKRVLEELFFKSSNADFKAFCSECLENISTAKEMFPFYKKFLLQKKSSPALLGKILGMATEKNYSPAQFKELFTTILTNDQIQDVESVLDSAFNYLQQDKGIIFDNGLVESLCSNPKAFAEIPEKQSRTRFWHSYNLNDTQEIQKKTQEILQKIKKSLIASDYIVDYRKDYELSFLQTALLKGKISIADFSNEDLISFGLLLDATKENFYNKKTSDFIIEELKKPENQARITEINSMLLSPWPQGKNSSYYIQNETSYFLYSFYKNAVRNPEKIQAVLEKVLTINSGYSKHFAIQLALSDCLYQNKKIRKAQAQTLDALEFLYPHITDSNNPNLRVSEHGVDFSFQRKKIFICAQSPLVKQLLLEKVQKLVHKKRFADISWGSIYEMAAVGGDFSLLQACLQYDLNDLESQTVYCFGEHLQSPPKNLDLVLATLEKRIAVENSSYFTNVKGLYTFLCVKKGRPLTEEEVGRRTKAVQTIFLHAPEKFFQISDMILKDVELKKNYQQLKNVCQTKKEEANLLLGFMKAKFKQERANGL